MAAPNGTVNNRREASNWTIVVIYGSIMSSSCAPFGTLLWKRPHKGRNRTTVPSIMPSADANDEVIRTDILHEPNLRSFSWITTNTDQVDGKSE